MRNARKLFALATLAVGIAAVIAPSAWGTTPRYASPTGSGEACTLGAPCDGRYAISGNAGSNPVADGDEVILLHGTYDFGNTSEVTIGRAVNVHGEPGFADPVLNGSSVFGLVRLANDGATLHDVDIEYGGTATSGAYGALMVTGGTAYRVLSQTGGTNTIACALGGNTTAPDALIRDSICQGYGSGGTGVGLYCGCSSFNASLRNVDAIGTYRGIALQSSLSGQTLAIEAKNVIAEGVTDVTASATNASGGTNDHAFITLDHSSYDSFASDQAGTGNTASVTPTGTPGNVAATAAQMFLCAPGCGSATDFHQRANSPTVNAGITDALTGTTDFDGNPRPQGAAMDIGAYEAAATPPSGGPGNPAHSPTKKKCKKKHKRAAASKKCKKRRK